MLWTVLLTVGIVAAVWFGFRYAERLGAERERERVGRKRRERRAGRSARDEPPPQVEDLVECRTCGAFVARDNLPCDRSDCPFA